MNYLSVNRHHILCRRSVPMAGSLFLRNISSRRMRLSDDMKVNLTDDEERICTLLDECTKYMKEEENSVTSCRIAGGWVRDKLLGAQSNDLDIALSDMMGFPFAERFVSWVSSKKNIAVQSISKVESNPEQSKHLETAKTKLFGIELEFVNLRSEEYTGNSRIPTQIRFGTPLDDALRRDITINALFYNVHSREVEDHTDRGLQDLRDGIIRTPLPPKDTFADDPLRVIRCVRFASRFGFDMVPELQEAARDSDIQTALALKISRERVGDEIDKMMKGLDPLRSIQIMNDLSLYNSIFPIPSAITSTFSEAPSPYITSLAAATILDRFLDPSTPYGMSFSLPPLHHLFDLALYTPSTKARLYLASALTPFAGITYTDSKGKQRPAVEAAIREGLKVGTQNHYLDGIPALFAAAEVLRNPDLKKFKEPSERVAIGLILRDKSVHNPITGSHWIISLLFSLVQEVSSLWDTKGDKFDVDEAGKRVQIYNSFMSRVEELGLPSSVDARPILDGREVVSELGAQPGPWTGQALARVIEWQLGHPDGNKAECVAWLRSEHAAGRVGNDHVIKRAKETDQGKMAKKAKR